MVCVLDYRCNTWAFRTALPPTVCSSKQVDYYFCWNAQSSHQHKAVPVRSHNKF